MPDIELIVKITYFNDFGALATFVREVGPLVSGITAINTIATRVVNTTGKQAFPGGSDRERPGMSGHAIKPLGLKMVAELARLRQKYGLTYKIIGVGGVQSRTDFDQYRQAGADVVMLVTGAMWNPNLAQEIKGAGQRAQPA